MADYRFEEHEPSAFLESFPTYRLHSKTGPFNNGLLVFSSKDEGYENNSYPSDDVGSEMTIYDKIISAFSKMDYRGDLIAQFWAPIPIGDKLQLSTSGQPFAVNLLYNDFIKYRRLRVEYACDIVVNSKFRGTPASAFLNRFPEIASMDLSVNHEVDPLWRYAFQECRLDSSVMIPICCPSQTSSSSDCIGVIECSSWFTAHVELFNEMIMKIKEAGLSVYNVQDRISYKTINGLKLARGQIQEALKIVCQSLQIALAQVWIASLDENDVLFSSSSEEAQTRLFGLKLTGCINEDSARYCCSFQNYYDACDLIPLQPGQELVMKTLQDYEPSFCKNISQLVTYKLMGWGSPVNDGTRGYTICMRSIHTGDFNYVFEFLWKDEIIMLEEIISKIKECLPSFKFASGTENGDKLHLIEVNNSIDKEIEKFNTFPKKTLSSMFKQVAVDCNAPMDTNCNTAPVLVPQQVSEQHFGTSITEDFLEEIWGIGDLMADCDNERLSESVNKGKKAMAVNYNACSKEKRDTSEKKLSREKIEEHYGKTEKQAAKELGVSLSTLKRKRKKLGMSGWQGPDLSQRKACKSNKKQSKESHTHEKNNGVIKDPSPIKRNETTVIKAKYAGDKVVLHLPNSEATFVTVENEICKEFKLKHGTFKIKYLDEDKEWILMKTDQDLNDCIQSSRNVLPEKKGGLRNDRFVVQLRVRLQ